MKGDVRDCALNLLARREHSSVELKRKLIARGYLGSEVDTLLVSLARDGLQSDERFAEAYVRHRAEMGFGPRRISAELGQRGVPHLLIQQYLSPDEAFWGEVLSSLWQRKYHNERPMDERTYGKQLRFLMQRGFELERVYRWLNEIKKKGCS